MVDGKDTKKGIATSGYEKINFINSDSNKSTFTNSDFKNIRSFDDVYNAALYLLTGIFDNIKNFNNPPIMPRCETNITYPHISADSTTRLAEEKAEIFEGLARSFLIAAPLLHISPALTINDYNISEYYKHHILRICTPSDPYYVGSYDYLEQTTNRTGTFSAFQQTVETCSLVMCLTFCHEVIWDTYTKSEQNLIADFIKSYAHAPTVPQNWRLFNMLDMAFLKKYGYEIDENIMTDHASAILDYYAGDGWYRDGHTFDYYSAFAFQFYAPLWCRWYGYEHMPYVARQFEEYSNRLMTTYAHMFDKDGFMIMWGRSNIYRFAVSCSFAANYMLNNHSADPVIARQITCSTLSQFLSRDDFLDDNGIPSLGFYGQFSPLVQGYSCAESPFWLGKIFVCLMLPRSHPFWSCNDMNNSNIWGNSCNINCSNNLNISNNSCNIKNSLDNIFEIVLNGPALVINNLTSNGETILRSGKVIKPPHDRHGTWCYAKLCYNSKYPWESAPDNSDYESMAYQLKEHLNGHTCLGNAVFFAGVDNQNILYRKLTFDYNADTERHWMHSILLADYAVPYGIMRVDKLRIIRPVSISLGSYGFPDNGTDIITLTDNYTITCNSINGNNVPNAITNTVANTTNNTITNIANKVANPSNIITHTAKAIILKGCDHTGRPKTLAYTIYEGFTELTLKHSTNTNPDSKRSVIPVATYNIAKQYDGNSNYIMISQTITRDDDSDFTINDIFPISRITYTDTNMRGAYGPITITLKDGTSKTIDYSGIEGRLMI